MLQFHNRVDLHVHSSFSDGTASPAQIITYALQLGLHGVSIADHDTISSWDSFQKEALAHNFIAISGVELSCEMDGEGVHVLGYAFKPNSKVLQDACSFHGERRKRRNIEIIESLRKVGIQITYEEVIQTAGSSQTIGRPHIAQVLMKKGHVATIQEAFKRYLGSKKVCDISGERWQVAEAIDLIHEANGYAVLAHPHLLSQFRKVLAVMKFPFDGIEACYGSFTERENRPFLEYALSNNLLVTGGSDFHGDIKPHNRLGSTIAPEKTIDYFLLRMKEHE